MVIYKVQYLLPVNVYIGCGIYGVKEKIRGVEKWHLPAVGLRGAID